MLVRMLVQADIGKTWKRHCGTMIGKAQQTTFALPKQQSVRLSKYVDVEYLTLLSKLRNLFLKSESSGAVIRLLLRFCTIILANSISYCEKSAQIKRM